ncbi:hypothetical protein [Acidithiobacillus sp.]|uniref:hypothetical protein n=1 Tax=Acidithiobacillus sp. TaxID=1872118 RepID=UPI002317D7E7|nr:hypothetical protein [Acidithiobacillus sp.]MDA8177109.1 hypothetical protein [Acidithiobacillus sp.]
MSKTKAAPAAPKPRKWPDERCNSWRFPDEEWLWIDRRPKASRPMAEDEWDSFLALVAENEARDDPLLPHAEFQKLLSLGKSWEYCIASDILDRYPLVYGRGIETAGKWFLQTASGQRVRLPPRQVFEIVADTIMEDGRVASAETILSIIALLKEAA